jgi:hypothetical protein
MCSDTLSEFPYSPINGQRGFGVWPLWFPFYDLVHYQLFASILYRAPPFIGVFWRRRSDSAFRRMSGGTRWYTLVRYREDIHKKRLRIHSHKYCFPSNSNSPISIARCYMPTAIRPIRTLAPVFSGGFAS